MLSTGGRIVIGFLPKEHMDKMGMPRDISTKRSPGEIVDALERNGFSGIWIRRPVPSTPWNVIVANRRTCIMKTIMKTIGNSLTRLAKTVSQEL